MHSFIQYDGSNYIDVLAFTAGFIRVTRKYMKLMIFIPMQGIVEVKKGDYIIKDSNTIKIHK